MKIVSITMVKNESDIIESFIRYQLNIIDEMIILDNFSSDETPNIINKLINEGLPIVLINDESNEYSQNIKMTKLLNKAIYEYDADIVCLLDCDEFITSRTNDNPRKIIEKLDTSKYHLIKWITFIPTPNDDYNIKFIPKRINHVRDENLETLYKLIVPKEIVKNYKVEVFMGNHDLKINGNKKELLEYNSKLKIAHYPLRSKEQCISKILIGWPNIISMNTENEPWAFHWNELFDKIKKERDISLTDLENFSKKYSIANADKKKISIKKQGITLDFCKNIDIKYETEYDYFSNILENYVDLAKEILLLKRELNIIKGKTGLMKSAKIKIFEKFLR